MTATKPSPRLVPASFFGMPLGLTALGIGWRNAAAVWSVPAAIGETLIGVGSALWALLLVLYVAKWIRNRPAAAAEIEHPVQCCFVVLAGVVASLVSIGAAPYSRAAALLLFAFGATWAMGFALLRTGHLWQGGRQLETTTAALYLPLVGGGFVTGNAAASLGLADWGQLAFGVALFSWLAIESVLLQRLYLGAPMAPPLRLTLGVQMAPPAVGATSYLSVGGGAPDIFVHALIGYGILQALLMLRLWPWLRQAGASPAWWSFSFASASLPTAMIKLLAHGETGAVALLAPWVFAAGNLAIAALAAMTLRLLFQGRLLPGAPPAAALPDNPAGAVTKR
jgi:tellurite resistance protein